MSLFNLQNPIIILWIKEVRPAELRNFHSVILLSNKKEGNVNIDNNVDTSQKILFKTGSLTWRTWKERGKSLQIWWWQF